MKVHLSIAILACALGVAIAPVLIARQEPPALGQTRELVIRALLPKSPAELTVASPAFKEGPDIPYENTQCRGNTSPGLPWTKGPRGTLSYAVIVQGGSLTRPGGCVQAVFKSALRFSIIRWRTCEFATETDRGSVNR